MGLAKVAKSAKKNFGFLGDLGETHFLSYNGNDASSVICFFAL